MPNNGRITICPFYKDEKNLSISCEDTFHRFRWPAQKKRHMDMFCDKDWQSCPYAMALLDVYRNGGEMDESVKLRNEVDMLKKELRKTATMLGKAEKREKDKDDKIRRLQRENDAIENFYIKLKIKYNECERSRNRLLGENTTLALWTERRIAYLVSEFADGIFDEREMIKWHDNHEYKIINCDNCIKIITREIKRDN